MQTTPTKFAFATLMLCLIIIIHLPVNNCTSDFQSSKLYASQSLKDFQRNDTDSNSSEETKRSYIGWRVLKLLVPTRNVMKKLMKKISARHETVVVLNEQRASDKTHKDEYEVQFAIDPKISLKNLLSDPGLPLLCCLDQDTSPDDTKCISYHEKTGERPPELMKWRTTVTDLGETINSSAPANHTEDEEVVMSWDAYHRFDTIHKFMFRLGEDYEVAETLKMNKTEEGRDIVAMIFGIRMRKILKTMTRKREKLSNKASPSERRRKQISSIDDNRDAQENDKEKRKKKFEKKYVKLSKKTSENKRRMGDQTRNSKNKPHKTMKNKQKKQKKSSKKKEKKKKNEEAKKKNGEEKKKNGEEKKKNGEEKKKNGEEKKKNEEEKKKNEEEKKKKKPKPKKKVTPFIMVEAGTHAREWISPAVATHLLQQLADSGKKFLRHFNFIVFPANNPDGYEYSHTTDRLWRKNKRNNPLINCSDGLPSFGVDLNRNWEYKWGGDGSSDDPCDYTYRGISPFSEPETSSVKQITDIFKNSLKMFISLHSFGQKVLYPWGYTFSMPHKRRRLSRMANTIALEMERGGHHEFQYGQASQILYVASGLSQDYMYQQGLPYSYTLELPNDKSFIIDPNQIEPIAKEVWAGLVCAVGLVVKTKAAKKFCNMKLVRVETENNEVIASWVSKEMTDDQARKKIIRDNQKKQMKRHSLKRRENIRKVRHKSKVLDLKSLLW